MPKADYTISKSPLVSTIFEISIGQKSGNPNQLSGTVDNIVIAGNKIHVRLRFGGIVDSSWKIVVTVDAGGNKFRTDPKEITGKIDGGGRSIIDKDFTLVPITASNV
jgi:hypothetical protein